MLTTVLLVTAALLGTPEGPTPQADGSFAPPPISSAQTIAAMPGDGGDGEQGEPGDDGSDLLDWLAFVLDIYNGF